MKKSALGILAVVVSITLLSVVMVPLRSHLGIATTALVLVIPVVVGVVIGGPTAGVVSVIAGFLFYDFFFIPPYLTLTVGASQNWVALGVYVVVMILVSQVVSRMNLAREEARRQSREIRELFEFSRLLVEDRALEELLQSVVSTVAEVFSARQVAILLPDQERLRLVASAGEPLSDTQLSALLVPAGSLMTVGARSARDDGLTVLALVAAGRPVGLLVLRVGALSADRREPLMLFANQIALSVERVKLRDRALSARVADEMARLAKTMVGAVSHDLRAPLATIKAAASTLGDPDVSLDAQTELSLVEMIDAQADRLADLVENLLDMSRIQTGVLKPRRSIVSLSDLLSNVAAHTDAGGHPVVINCADPLPFVDADPVLVGRVVSNLLENAVRYSPTDTAITVEALVTGPAEVTVSVADRGPGIDIHRHEEVFDMLRRRDVDSGAGVGLVIAKTFVEAHGGRIWVDDSPAGGAVMSFTLPATTAVTEELDVGADTRN
jgi:two-component system sensor histidine kinase KdpD